MRRWTLWAAAAFIPGVAFGSNNLPGDRELLAFYCSVVVDAKLATVRPLSSQVESNPNTPEKYKKTVAATLAELHDQRRQLDSFLRPVIVAAQESDGSAYTLALLSSADRAESDIAALSAKGPDYNEAFKRLARCSNLSWLP